MTGANPPELLAADLVAIDVHTHTTEIRDSVKPDIMLHNAARLFGLEKDER
jgi:hypothetical protein